MVPIEGVVPDPSDVPKGCGFEPRCSLAKEICRNRVPLLEEVVPGHMVACWLDKS